MGRALALDVTDAGVLGIGEGGKLVGPSPGYALADGKTLLVGEEAFRCARLRPRFVMSRFWERLDTEPLGRPFPRMTWCRGSCSVRIRPCASRAAMTPVRTSPLPPVAMPGLPVVLT